jgi:hypothetical protein
MKRGVFFGAVSGLLLISCPSLIAQLMPTRSSLLAQYKDQRSGRCIVVGGKASQVDALRWLAEVVKTEDAEGRARIVAAFKSQGLLEATSLPAGVEIVLVREGILSRYTDTRSRWSIIVMGGTPQAQAAQWLKEVSRGGDAATLAAMVAGGHSQGLLEAVKFASASAGAEIVEIAVAWGSVRKLESVPYGSADEDAAPSIMGTSLMTSAQMGEWLGEVFKAATEADLVAMIRTHHAQGLRRASAYFREADMRMRVDVSWIAP